MALLIEMQKRELVERFDSPFPPFVAAKNDVAIKPSDLTAGAWHPPDPNVKESLFLPHHIGTMYLNEYVGIVSSKFESAIEREFNSILRCKPG